jgi:hypothetical protein
MMLMNMKYSNRWLRLSLALFCCSASVFGFNLDDGVLYPFRGESIKGVDLSSLDGKVMCGYQGWFGCEGDGSKVGWVHWGRGKQKPMPGKITIDAWPDTREYDADELFDTGFKYKDGSVAKLFSSYHPKTVDRHFRWMKEYNMDGVFMQRFVPGLKSPELRDHKSKILMHARESANRYGRAYAVMYDLSGIRSDGIELLEADWKELSSIAEITKDPAYLNHNGKPLVAIWGIGFNDNRRYSLQDCERAIDFIKSEGCSVMLGVPPTWHEQGADTINDEDYLRVLAKADVISPWAVGRFGSIKTARLHAQKYYPGDTRWCKAHNIDFLPVVFPGFSWTNLLGPSSPLDQIPRLKGRFMWEQIVQTQKYGCNMIYVAMFDEVDEGTAIFKCSNRPPVGNFLDMEGLPSDYYLRLVQAAAELVRGDRVLTEGLPKSLTKFHP